nr:uncharacterized protein K02A2.6-like [Helicoverpa armigera]
MCDLSAPDNPENKTFTALVELVKNHLEPKRSEIAERHVFRQRRQGEGESINVFLQKLKHLATYCNFGDQLEVNLRDQFVSGLRSEEIRSRLFAETTLDYKKAVGLALALEAAEQHAAKAVAPAALWAAAGPAGFQADAGERVHRVSVAKQASAAGRDDGPPRRDGCWRCGRDGHAPHRCRYKSTILHPLHALLKKGVTWVWSESCNAAFEEIKVRLTSDPVLAHYSPALPLVLAVDSSAYGLGAVLAQRYPDGSERLVCCASRTLNDAERRYSQVDKEALAIVYGVTRHHQYLFGRHFTLKSDHKALSYIFGPKKGIPQTAASRLQRYAVRLAAYDFNIVFVSSEKNSNADGLSRLPLAKTKAEDQDDAAYLHFVEDNFPLSHKDVAQATKEDKILCKVYGYIMSGGWPLIGDSEDEKAYFHRRENLHIDHGCIVWGYRIVVPERLRAQILEEVHTGHVGVVRMKSIARNYVWWPRLDSDIEARAAACAACRAQLDAPPRHTPVPYVWPSEPWTRLHVDFLQYQGKYYFLILDSHSKWIEVFLMGTGTSAKLVTNKLRECFSRFGLPKCLVSDGGPPFRSEEFELFLTRNGIKHILIAPYHPSSNGAAENAVKTVKKVIKKAASEGQNIERAINNFLLIYRNSTHSSTQREPSVALLGRRLRMRLDLLRASTADTVEAAQAKQVEHARGMYREVQPGERVLFRDYSRNNPKWMEGQIAERTGAVTYRVKSDQGEYRKHIDQIMPLRRHTRSSNPMITDIDTETVNTDNDTWESAPNSPVTSSPTTSEEPPVIHESISGDWVNNKPRNRNHKNTIDNHVQ